MCTWIDVDNFRLLIRFIVVQLNLVYLSERAWSIHVKQQQMYYHFCYFNISCIYLRFVNLYLYQNFINFLIYELFCFM
jgi:hypothetical protein